MNRISVGELVPMQFEVYKIIAVDTDDLVKVQKDALKYYKVLVLTASELLKIESGEVIEDLDVYRIVSTENNLVRLELEELDLGDLGMSKVILIDTEDLKTIGGNPVIDLSVYRIISIANDVLLIKSSGGLETELVISEMYKVTNLSFSEGAGGTIAEESGYEETVEIVSSS